MAGVRHCGGPIPGGIRRPPRRIQIERNDAHVGFPQMVAFWRWWWSCCCCLVFLVRTSRSTKEWHDLMPLSLPPLSALSKLRQRLERRIAGASVMSVGSRLLFQDFVKDVEGTWSAARGNGEGFGGFGGRNVGQSVGEGGQSVGEGGQSVGEGGQRSMKGGDGRCGGFVGGDVDDAGCQQWFEVFGAMWNASAVKVLMLMRTREQEGADPWRSFRDVDDSIENWPSSSACSLDGVRAGILCGGSSKVISNADHQNKSDLVIERDVTDLCWLGNDVTVSCSSVILKYTNAGRELQKKVMQKEALADADCLLQNFRRPFIFIQIIESRVGQDRRASLYDPKFYSATFKKQVFDAQSLRLLEDCSGTSSQPDMLQHWQPSLYRGFNDSLFQSFMGLGWRSIWTLWHYFLLQLMKSVVLFQFR